MTGLALAALSLPLSRVCPYRTHSTVAFTSWTSLALPRQLDWAAANVKAVQKMLGHASAAMTLDIYADLFDDDLEAVATALDAAREKCAHPVLMGGAER